MEALNFKLRSFIDENSIAPVEGLTAKITGTVDEASLEVKVPLESGPYDTAVTAADATVAKFRSAKLADLTVISNQVFIEPVVEFAGASESTSNVKISITLIVASKKPWEGGL
jgi:hypothetical protein